MLNPCSSFAFSGSGSLFLGLFIAWLLVWATLVLPAGVVVCGDIPAVVRSMHRSHGAHHSSIAIV